MYTVEATDGLRTASRQYANADAALYAAESAWEVYGADVTVYAPDGTVYAEYEN